MGPLLPGLGSLHKSHLLPPPMLLAGLLRVHCTPCALVKAKTVGVEGSGVDLFSQQLLPDRLSHHGFMFPARVFWPGGLQ